MSSIKNKDFSAAAEIRDLEKKLSFEIFTILKPESVFVNFQDCDKIIEDYCIQKFNCSSYNYSLCLKSIERLKKLNNLGL